MNKQHLHRLLTRYRSGNCTQQEKRLVEHWFTLIDSDQPQRSAQENKEIEDRIWSAVQGDYHRVTAPRRRVVSLCFSWRSAAAVLFVAMAWFTYHLTFNKSGSQQLAILTKQRMTIKTNNTAQPLLFTLSDGSSVKLLPESSIKYPVSFIGAKREVYLSGKAFFDITKDPEHPFLVYTQDIATKVLGTSFWVDATYEQEGIEVSVVTGRVSVFERDQKKPDTEKKTGDGVVLLANQRVNYTASSRSFVTGLVSEPVMHQAYQGAFVFSDTPLREVTALLEKAYGIQILLADQKLKNCLFTADINKQPFLTKLEMISSSVNADYKVVGTKIVLSGEGCQSN